MLPQTATISAHRYGPDGFEPVELLVSAEYHMTFLVNGRPYLTVACSGSDLEIMAAGHLLSEGIIMSREEIERIEVDEEGMSVNVVTSPGADVIGRLFRVRTMVSGCAGGGTGTGCRGITLPAVPLIDPSVIIDSAKEFLGLSTIYRHTHGVHSAALYDIGGSRIAFYDEIGRHNAVDKLLGFALTGGVGLDQAMLFSTGRISSEIVSKVAAARIPVLVTRAAPTSMAVGMAREIGLVLVTGVRRDGFYVHHGRESLGAS
ncbi:MAG: formate dehydrogenase accessory sulfurtransferase FdhD [Spirochaetes bacterium]|nr:formate dehydrogenase accessory sulfurtransferase FdhD [Spirochaetota bacterium]